MNHRTALAALVVGTAVVLGGCASQHHASAPATSAPALVQPRAVQATPIATPTEASAADTCQALADTKVLQSAEGFVIVADSLAPGDVASTILVLQQLEGDAPGAFRGALGMLWNGLQNLDDVITAGGGSVDTNVIIVNVELLASLCHVQL